MSGPKVPPMSEDLIPNATTSADALLVPSTNNPLPTPSRPPPISLLPPEKKKKKKKTSKRATSNGLLSFFSLCRPLPVFTLHCRCCKIPTSPLYLPESRHPGGQGTIVTGTLLGYRRGRVSFSLQDAPKRLPTLVLELPIQTHFLFREMSSGMVRIALECEKQPRNSSSSNNNSSSNDNIVGSNKERRKRSRHRRKKQNVELLEEPTWTVFFNGRKRGYGTKRDPNEVDLNSMSLLHAVSTGAGVLPGTSDVEGPDGELAYMRAGFDHVIGSKDSETLYMISPEGGTNGPDLTIFFLRT